MQNVVRKKVDFITVETGLKVSCSAWLYIWCSACLSMYFWYSKHGLCEYFIVFSMGITNSFPRSWECERCTYLNDPFSGTCRICGTAKENKSWICCKCGHSNPLEIVLCNSCGSERTTFGDKNKSKGPTKDWTCLQCTSVSSSNSGQCTVCGFTPIDDKGAIAVQVDSTRLEREEIQEDLLKCHKCQTLLYDNTGNHCTVCGTTCLTEGFKPRPFPQSSLPKETVTDSDTPNTSNLWKCSQCTLLNDSKLTVCKACSNKNGDIKRNPMQKLIQLGKLPYT